MRVWGYQFLTTFLEHFALKHHPAELDPSSFLRSGRVPTRLSRKTCPLTWQPVSSMSAYVRVSCKPSSASRSLQTAGGSNPPKSMSNRSKCHSPACFRGIRLSARRPPRGALQPHWSSADGSSAGTLTGRGSFGEGRLIGPRSKSRPIGAGTGGQPTVHDRPRPPTARPPTARYRLRGSLQCPAER